MISHNVVQQHFWHTITVDFSTVNEKISSKKMQFLVQIILKCVIKVWVKLTWSTKEYQLTILIVNLQLHFIYLFFSIWWCQSLCQHLHGLQYDESKRPYPA